MPHTIHHHHHHATINHHATPKHNPKLLSILLKFIIMSLILSIFLIFLGLAAIIIILLGLCSFLHRRRSQPPPTTANSLLGIQTCLPLFYYSGAATTSDCSICLEGFKDGESCRALPVCDHVFHANCVDAWLVKVANCPVCRTPVRVEVGRPSSLSVNDDEYKFLWAIGVGR